MADGGTGGARREKVEPGIWRRRNAKGDWTYDIAFKDADGKQRFKVVKGGVRAARAALAAAHTARAGGERPAVPLTFEEAAEAWYAARLRGWRPHSSATYRGFLNNHLLPEFGKRRMANITASDIATYISQKKLGEMALKGWTLKAHVGVLGSIFKHAIRHMGLVAVNPVTLLDRFERPNTEDEREHRILAPDELTALLGAVEDMYRMIFRFAAETGARLGEVLGLIWADLDLDGQAVTFTSQLQDKKRARLKTPRSRRTIEIAPGLAAELRKHRRAAPANRSSDQDYVFLSRAGTPSDHRNVGGRVLARAVKEAKLEAVERDGVVIQPAPTFHDLRHTHASAMLAQGFDIEQVSDRLGHASVAVTMAIYTHEYDKARRSEGVRSKLADMYPGAGSAG
jgi:integrase